MILKSSAVTQVEEDIDKANEEVFHDEWAGSIDPKTVMVDESWEAATCPEHRWIRQQLGDLKGKKVLDVGCGAGEAAVWFAKQGADVTACDISQGFLDLVHRVAALHGTRVKTAQVDADGLNMPADTFDIVYCGNLLHHVHLEPTLLQMKHCLKPGGKLVTWDPLCHNPVINVYRRMASQVRTEDEHPLHVRDLKTFHKHFADVKAGYFWFTTLWIFLRFYLIERVHPNQDRYWKKIIREHVRLAPIHRRYERIDQVLLSAFPILKRYCWNMAVCATKGSHG